MTKELDNVCYCRCHKTGKDRCHACKIFHMTLNKPATDQADTSNPDIPEVANS